MAKQTRLTKPYVVPRGARTGQFHVVTPVVRPDKETRQKIREAVRELNEKLKAEAT